MAGYCARQTVEELIGLGLEAYLEEDFRLAISYWFQAKTQSPQEPKVLLYLASAKIALHKCKGALKDATSAEQLLQSQLFKDTKAKPGGSSLLTLGPLLAQALVKQGECHFHLSNYGKALAAFDKAAHHGTYSGPKIETWRERCRSAIEVHGPEDSTPVMVATARGREEPAAKTADPAGVVSDTMTVNGMEVDRDTFMAAPEKLLRMAQTGGSVAKPVIEDITEQEQERCVSRPTHAASTEGAIATAPVDVPNRAPPAAGFLKYRYQHYQVGGAVVVDVFAKKLSRDDVAVRFKSNALEVTIVGAGGEADFELGINLFAEIDAAHCRFEVLSSKIEIRLAKADASLPWPTLEAPGSNTYNWSDTEGMDVGEGAAAGGCVKRRPDWDSLAAELQEEEKNVKLDGEAARQKFFREIYQSGDEDMRRAMNKSLEQSGGTVLSTNWADVGSRNIELSPPPGMEVKKQ